MRIVLKALGLLFVFLILIYGYLTIQNNKSVQPPSAESIRNTFEKSILWLENNREKVLAENNPILWYMIHRASKISDDQRLRDIFSEYEQRYLINNPNNIWSPFFYPNRWVPVHFENIASLPYYNHHFIYALLCDSELENISAIAEQNHPDFCDSHPLRPACVTHQLMGIQLLQRSQCGDAEELAATSKILQKRIANQLYYDIRVVDVYLQRVLMLVDTGAMDLVKPSWIQNLIDAQLADGGWSEFDPLIPLGGGRFFGYGQKFFAIKHPIPSFHTVAQGVLLFSLLDNQQTQ
ncbi:MAG: hypothetical protein V3W04_09890 [Gammaproteobacteria bacterium]